MGAGTQGAGTLRVLYTGALAAGAWRSSLHLSSSGGLGNSRRTTRTTPACLSAHLPLLPSPAQAPCGQMLGSGLTTTEVRLQAAALQGGVPLAPPKAGREA